MTVKGRYWIAAWLLFFLVTLGWVNLRQTASLGVAGDLADIAKERSALEALRAEQQQRIRELTGRAALIPRAESLGLRLAGDSEIVFLRIQDEER